MIIATSSPPNNTTSAIAEVPEILSRADNRRLRAAMLHHRARLGLTPEGELDPGIVPIGDILDELLVLRGIKVQ